ncbi:MAG: caspase family protein [Cyclobacteriaceae bacterium]|nr:caspase family protein [Cyclobacteriaceae bacterium]
MFSFKSFCIFTTGWLIISISGFAQVPRIVINPQGHTGKIHSLIFTPDASQLISISEDKTIRIWNARTGAMEKKFETQIGDGYEGMLYASALSPNGKLLAVGGYQVATEKENYVIIIDIEKGVQVATAVGHTNVITSLSFTGSGQYLASGSADGTVRIWEMTNFPNLVTTTVLNISLPVSSLSFSRTTQDLAVACESKDVLIYPLSGLRTGERQFAPKSLRKHRGVVSKVTYSPDGAFLVSSSYDNELVLWNARGDAVLDMDKLKHPITAFAFSFDGKILAALDVTGHGTTFTIPAGTPLAEFKGHDNTVFSAVFSPSVTSNYMVASAGGNNNEILLWNPINGLTISKIKGKGGAIYGLAFGEGYELFVSKEFQDIDQTKKMHYESSFDFSSFSISRDPAKAPTAPVAPKEVIQTGVNSLELAKGKTIQTDADLDGRILQFRVLPDGSVIIASDFSLKMFDKNGFLSKEFVGHLGSVRAITVSKDGKYLASGGEDQSVILWRLSEAGFAPTMRSVFEGPEWSEYFSSLPVDSLTSEPTKKAWEDVILFLKNNGQKVYKQIDEKYKSLGEIMIPYATLFLTNDNEWVCWTPRGYFSCSSAGAKYFGWHINRGIEKLADFYEADQFFEILYRPTEMSKSIPEGRRVEDILRESGERIFDLGKLNRPSAAFFENYALRDSTDIVHSANGKLVTAEKTIPINVEIYDGGGGVKEVNIYQNDKLIIRDTAFVSRTEGEKTTRSYTAEMTNDENVFKVKVINYYKVESRPDVLTVQYTGKIQATSSLYLLSVGINKYENASYELNYARPDATAFTEKILEQNKGVFKAIHKTEIYDTDATRSNILSEFKSIISRAKPEDVFMFYYAGHGTLDVDNQGGFYLVPTEVTKMYADAGQLEAKCISDAELKNNLMQLKAQKQIVFMDACHSGAAVANMKVRAGGAEEKAMVTLARSSGVAMLASSGTQQFAAEFEQLRHGTFTYALLEALDGKADLGGDGQVTVNEIKVYMDERVPELTKEFGGKAQYPTGYTNGNDFPISVLNRLEESVANQEDSISNYQKDSISNHQEESIPNKDGIGSAAEEKAIPKKEEKGIPKEEEESPLKEEEKSLPKEQGK